MTAIANPIDVLPTLAERRAWENWGANSAALQVAQPGTAESLPPVPAQWSFIYGRDGALTAIDHQGNWWQGCSLPKRTARALLRSLAPTGRVSCYLVPSHGAQIRVAIEKLPADHAVIALCPDATLISVMLRCDDFSMEIAEGRLFFVAGANWPEGLRQLYRQYSCLPTPEQFIRNNAANLEPVNSLIPAAEKVFAEQTAERSTRIRNARENWTPTRSSRPRICLLARSHFHLWDDAGATLAQAMQQAGPNRCDVRWVDTDRPTSAAPVALAEAAQGCDAVLAVNLARRDLPELIACDMPWITWLTRDNIPAFATHAAKDLLLVTHESARQAAIDLGWPEAHVRMASWPARTVPPRRADDKPPYLAIISDTWMIEPPARVKDLSSQLLIWEAIAADIAENPFAAIDDPEAYLRRQQRSMRIPDEGLEANVFLQLLIAPATTQSLARWMLGQRLPVRIFGAGWESLPDVQPAFGGNIASPEQLDQAIAGAAALVYAWPGRRAHPIESINRPLLRVSAGKSSFLQAAASAIQGRLAPPPPLLSPLDAQAIVHAILQANVKANVAGTISTT